MKYVATMRQSLFTYYEIEADSEEEAWKMARECTFIGRKVGECWGQEIEVTDVEPDDG